MCMPCKLLISPILKAHPFTKENTSFLSSLFHAPFFDKRLQSHRLCAIIPPYYNRLDYVYIPMGIIQNI